MKQGPISKEHVSNSKTPKTIEQVGGYYGKSPAWRFSKSDVDHPRWSVREPHEDIFHDPDDPTGTKIGHVFSKSVDSELIEGLKSREIMTWSEILTQNGGRGKKGGTNSHFIPMYNLVKEAQDRAAELNILEDGLISLRITSKKRVFGIMEDGVLNIVWFDRSHEICPAVRR